MPWKGPEVAVPKEMENVAWPSPPTAPLTDVGLTTDVDEVSLGLVFHLMVRDPVSVVAIARPPQVWLLVASLMVPLIDAPVTVTGVPPAVGVTVQLLALPEILVASLLTGPPALVSAGLKLALALMPVQDTV